ncbi:hypothetical protein T03_16021 [Trichinella britovi]|uniref:Uncharacterized protein n=1 Tax=Trichinella britovi TaxID=45882 RepID=A0A0V1DCU6_TRIBR|nr:hypothetical protein T03_16021 [Trichinella britovi]
MNIATAAAWWIHCFSERTATPRVASGFMSQLPDIRFDGENHILGTGPQGPSKVAETKCAVRLVHLPTQSVRLGSRNEVAETKCAVRLVHLPTQSVRLGSRNEVAETKCAVRLVHLPTQSVRLGSRNEVAETKCAVRLVHLPTQSVRLGSRNEVAETKCAVRLVHLPTQSVRLGSRNEVCRSLSASPDSIPPLLRYGRIVPIALIFNSDNITSRS